ncbi:MAG: response regulator [Butyrivibrio sp.]|nr:response regulator [Butyrivibrio sp.]
MSIGIAVDCLLLMLGAVSAVLGISFYMRNFRYSRVISTHIFFYGMMAALWCVSYGLIGVTERLEWCGWIRMAGLLAVYGFLVNECFFVCKMWNPPRIASWLSRGSMVVVSVVDYVLYSQRGLDNFMKVGTWTTWYANPAYAFNRQVHSVYMVFSFIILFCLALGWYSSNKLVRQRKFIAIMIAANFLLIVFAIPDTLLPLLGLHALPTSGIGGALCVAVIWYGATQLNYFDIRMGNIAGKVIDFIDAGILVFDTQRQVIISNQYCIKLMKGEYLLGSRVDTFFNMDEIDEDTMFRQALADVFSARLTGKEQNSTYSVRLNALKDDYGDPFCFVCVFADVTEEMEMIDKLEVASSAKSRFLAQMSHEIRTPIHAILGMNEMILRESSEPAIKDYAGNIDSAGHTLLSLINNILDVSKIEEGKMEILPVRYDTASFVNDLVNSVQQQATDKGLRFGVHVDENLPCTLIGDDVRLSQVIRNLLMNAVKYTERGVVSLTVRYDDRKGKFARIFVSVKDTGIGIRKEELARIYESFERLDEIRNRSIEGTGLGISIVRDLLELMNSRLHVESIYGEGSSFFFTIEQEIADDTPIGPYEKRVRETAAVQVRESVIYAPDARILVVDDNEMNLQVMFNLLKLCGIKPDLAASGAEAITAMTRKTYDIVFMDHMMPQMDGIETLHRLQEKNLVPAETTMIVLTANAIAGARERYLKEGFADYLTKPIEMKRLMKVLQQNLDSSEIEETTDTPVQNQEEQQLLLPPVEGVDWNRAYANMPDHEMLKQLLHTFCDMAQGETDDLQTNYMSGVTGFDDEALELYRVKVHAMKHSAAQIGADTLSEEAKALEYAARDGGRVFIVAHHEAFRKHYLDTAEQIRRTVFGEEAQARATMDRETLLQNLSLMETAIQGFDTFQLNELSFVLGRQTYETEAITGEVHALQEAVRDFDQERFAASIGRLRALLG